MFVGVHVMLAERMQAPELMMDMREGEAFMGAAQNVMRHYSVQTTQKALDWIALMGTAAGMYGPRVVAYQMRRKHEQQRYRPPAGAIQPEPVAAEPQLFPFGGEAPLN